MAMLRKWLSKLHVLSREFRVRMILIALLSVLAVGAAKLLDPLIPQGLSDYIGASALDRLLEMIANSMLAVTTFSVTIVVTVHLSAAQQWTPRAHLALLRDSTTQIVLATFIGAYIYALLAIILLSTPYFGEKEVVTLFLTTITVLALIVFALVRWIMRLRTFGSLLDTGQRIEAETQQSFSNRLKRPCLGCNALFPEVMPDGLFAIMSEETAYLQEIYTDSLQNCAVAYDVDIYVVLPVGSFAHRGQVLAWVSKDSPELAAQVKANFRFGRLRTIDSDPRFGLIQLAEIGCKALSAGINDPGTAIDVTGRLARVLGAVPDEKEPLSSVENDRVWIKALDPADLVQDAFGAMARDGAGQVEVLIRIQKNLQNLVSFAEAGISAAAKVMMTEVFERGRDAPLSARDLERLKDVTPEPLRDA